MPGESNAVCEAEEIFLETHEACILRPHVDITLQNICLRRKHGILWICLPVKIANSSHIQDIGYDGHVFNEFTIMYNVLKHILILILHLRGCTSQGIPKMRTQCNANAMQCNAR